MLRVYQVDAFTDVPFRGNPAAVCVLDQAVPDQWMQDVAAEMNLSETAFVLKATGGYSLRWFTPRKEVSLCGHATLATAHILWSEGLENGSIRFQTASGTLAAEADNGFIVLDFPARMVQRCQPIDQIHAALGVAHAQFTGQYITPRGVTYFAELDSEASVRHLQPDFKSLAAAPARATIVTSRSSSDEYDFVSRYFAPAIGIDEDPVTGSAHCCLAPYWSAAMGKARLTGLQVSQRGGVVVCRHQNDRVFLEGKAVTVLKADLLV